MGGMSLSAWGFQPNYMSGAKECPAATSGRGIASIDNESGRIFLGSTSGGFEKV